MKKKTILKVITEAARHHLTALILITILDLYFISAEISMTIYFSALLPQLLTAYGYIYGKSDAMAAFLPAGIALAALCLFLLAYCLVFSYKNRGWLLCGAGLMCADIAAVIYAMVKFGDGYLPDLLIHIWVILALAAGYAASLAAEKLEVETVCDGDTVLEEINSCEQLPLEDKSDTAEQQQTIETD